MADRLLPSEAAPRVTSAGGRAAAEHAVQFCETEELLGDTIGDFVAAGLAEGDSIAIFTTRTRRESIGSRLRMRGVDVDSTCEKGQIRFFDAHETLEKFMVGAMPDWDRFEATIAPIVRDMRARGLGRVRAYGDMVDVLWRAENPKAAIRLEEMWADLQVGQAFSLLCAYVVAGFYKESADFQRVCALHNHVVTITDGAKVSAQELGSDGVLSEVVERRRVEATLRQSLRELRRTEQELRRRELEREAVARRTDRLMKITTAIAEAVTPVKVHEAVVDEVASALGASTAGLWLVDHHQRELKLVRSFGYPEAANGSLATLALDAAGSYPVVDAVRQREPIWIASQADLIQRYPDVHALVTQGRTYSIACLPMFARDRTQGVLALTFEGTDSIEGDQRAFMMLVSRYSGQALERLRLLDSERESRTAAEVGATRVGLLYGLARALIAADNVQQVFDAALDAIERALGTERASILAFDPDGVMRFRAWRGLSESYRRAVEGHSPWSRDERAPQPVLVPDVTTEPAFAGYGPLFASEHIAALGFIPLVAGGELIGKFMVYYDQPRRLDDNEIELARAIANHVAAAIGRFAALAGLRQTVRFNEMFTAILGHDLRNPLGAIMTAAQLAMMQSESEKLVKPLSRIMSSGGRMARMIDQLLDFTRVRVGAGIPLSRRKVDLLLVLRQVMDELDDANPDCVLRLRHDGDTTGFWDHDRLSQVFSNLVANAVQHGLVADGVDVVVDGREADQVTVEVRNMGVIPAELLPTLFEPMTVGERCRHKSEGLGLGLYITQEILRAHGGRIDVRSSEAQGTVFAVDLPRSFPRG